VTHKNVRQVIDSGYNRYTHNDGPLPAWFVEEETPHLVPTLPITKEMVKEIKDEQRAIDERPIKKVLQAKARKHHKTMRKMEKLKSKAESITENVSLTGMLSSYVCLYMSSHVLYTHIPQ
jgi:AdoMet-dependent rRNA methyltransferase SPB1